MIERIKKIIEYLDISQSEFAKNLDIQRSSISHILNKRNKPSLDFIMKVLDHYPEINPDWLLFGKDKMLKEAKNEQDKGNKDNTDKQNNTTENNSSQKQTNVNNDNNTTNNQPKQPQSSIQISPDQILVLYDDNTFITYKRRQ